MGNDGGFSKSNLPSNKIIEDLLDGKDINNLKSLISSSDNSSDIIEKITEFNTSIQVGYNKIKKECTTTNNQKCCRTLNYYLDFVTANIYLSQIMDKFKPDLIVQLEDPWNTKRSSEDYVCDRETDNYSILKRCIVKQIYDFNYDKNYLNTYSDKNKDLSRIYDEYLSKEWCDILKNAKSTINDKKVIVRINGIYKDIGYDDLPFKYTFLKSNNFINNENDKLIISIEEHSNALDNNHSQSGNMTQENIREHQKNAEKEIQSKKVFFVKDFLIYCYIITVIIFLILILYKFSPLGSYVSKKIMKKKYIQKYKCKNTEDIFSQNTDNNKFNIAYISYFKRQENNI
ncbi:variable surface protein [Plasmodium gonderi]|uniref:Variable surface protein n=1 Tax=Plasmodium gonderi TaxID=77519 RepID=A0A1Y1JT31_PLAGO|nr:variable surface protein [Plasmodium gonderi]GAW84615.1 variable surface protein [Plasmodium gonderi]